MAFCLDPIFIFDYALIALSLNESSLISSILLDWDVDGGLIAY
jgi:hypothetical protein